jgi:hypothetical protein
LDWTGDEKRFRPFLGGGLEIEMMALGDPLKLEMGLGEMRGGLIVES